MEILFTDGFQQRIPDYPRTLTPLLIKPCTLGLFSVRAANTIVAWQFRLLLQSLVKAEWKVLC